MKSESDCPQLPRLTRADEVVLKTVDLVGHVFVFPKSVSSIAYVSHVVWANVKGGRKKVAL